MAWVRTAVHSSASGLSIDGLPSRVFGTYRKQYELPALEHSTKFHNGREKNDEGAAPFLMFVKVKRVIGATTIMLESGQRVRLIGVNTPETKHPKKQVEAFGKEASEFTRKMVEGKLVRIELVSCLRSSMNKLVSMASIYGE